MGPWLTVRLTLAHAQRMSRQGETDVETASLLVGIASVVVGIAALFLPQQRLKIGLLILAIVVLVSALVVAANSYFGHERLAESSSLTPNVAVGPPNSPSPTDSSLSSSSSPSGPASFPVSSTPSRTSPTTWASEPPSPRDVPLKDICGCGGEHSMTIGGQVFIYLIASGNAGVNARPPNWTNLFEFSANTCSHIILHFAPYGVGKAASSLRVIQQTLPPVQSSTPVDKIGTLNADLDRGPFVVQFNSEASGAVALNGSLTCMSSSGT